MALDSILVALIEESTLAHVPARRRAARIILDRLRSAKTSDGLGEGLISIDMQRDVKEQVRHLLERYGLGRVPLLQN